MAVVPQGSGWHCEVGTPANACYRDQTVCNVAVFKARGAEGSPCNAAATATCVTYTQKGVDKADCLAETALCNKYRLWLADKDPEVASTISVCKVMP